MLPNLKFLVCGILFCFLLFAAAGTGVMLPDSRTRIGEMPEIGRPMMQRSMAEAPAPPHFYVTTLARRSDEPDRPHEHATETHATETQVAAAPAQPEADLPKPDLLKPDLSTPEPEPPKPDVVANAPVGDTPPANPAPDGVLRAEVAAVQNPPAPTVEPRDGDRPHDAAPPQVATVAPPAAEDSEAIPPFVNVPLPPPRPAAFNGRRHGRMFYRKQRIARQQRDTFGLGLANGQGAPANQAAPASQGATIYFPSDAPSR
jgi:hypothetical protein